MLSETAATAPVIADGRAALEAAAKLVAAGDLGLETELSKVDAAIEEGQQLVGLERAKVEREQLVRRWVRMTVLIMIGLFLATVAIILWILNRRRAAIMQKALATISERESQVMKETEGIDRLFTSQRRVAWIEGQDR